jgi:hypothetical protein
VEIFDKKKSGIAPSGQNLLYYQLTKIQTQCVQRTPTIIVMQPPKRRPAFENALGIARMPVLQKENQLIFFYYYY